MPLADVNLDNPVTAPVHFEYLSEGLPRGFVLFDAVRRSLDGHKIAKDGSTVETGTRYLIVVEIWDPQLSPDGRFVLLKIGYLHQEADCFAFYYLDRVSGQLYETDCLGRYQPAQWSPDGKRFSYVTGVTYHGELDNGKTSICVYDLTKHATISDIPVMGFPRYCWLGNDNLTLERPHLAREGRAVGSESPERDLYVHSLVTGRESLLIKDGYRPQASPDGRWLYFVNEPRGGSDAEYLEDFGYHSRDRRVLDLKSGQMASSPGSGSMVFDGHGTAIMLGYETPIVGPPSNLVAWYQPTTGEYLERVSFPEDLAGVKYRWPEGIRLLGASADGTRALIRVQFSLEGPAKQEHPIREELWVVNRLQRSWEKVAAFDDFGPYYSWKSIGDFNLGGPPRSR